MTKVKTWISAARLRTLPLSVSGIIVGASLYNNSYLETISIDYEMIKDIKPPFYTTTIFALAILTTLGLQILSNFANDYGDGVKGTDNKDRIGPERALQSGALSKSELFRGIVVTAIIALLSAIALIYVSFGQEYFGFSVFFFLLGIIAIIAAMKYTMGQSAYGYRGLGDVFVFVFFGIVSVMGCYVLFTKKIDLLVFLPAFSIGMLSTAVLNLNNMRDRESDKKAGKNTLVVKIGMRHAKNYHFFLVLGAMISMIIFTSQVYKHWVNLLFVITFIPLIIHLIKVKKTRVPLEFDPELKKVALTTFAMALLFGIGQVLI